MDYEQLSAAGKIDFEILQHELTRALWLAENTSPFEQDPRVYSGYISDSIFLLLTQSTLPKEKNIANAIARMAHIPKVVAAVRENLNNPSPVATDTAIRQNRGSIGFYEQEIFEIVGQTPQRDALQAAAAPVVACLKEYQEFLEKDVRPRANGDWRLGRDKFAKKLELELNAGLTADQVLAEAEAEFRRVERDMYVIARQLWSRYYAGQPLPPDDDSGRRDTVARVLHAVGQEHGPPETLTQDARATVARIQDFIRQRHILRLPDPGPLPGDRNARIPARQFDGLSESGAAAGRQRAQRLRRQPAAQGLGSAARQEPAGGIQPPHAADPHDPRSVSGALRAAGIRQPRSRR